MDNAFLAQLQTCARRGPPRFIPTRAAVCGRCGLSTQADVFARVQNRPAAPSDQQGYGEPLCPLCCLGVAPVAGAITLAVLPEFSQSELNILCTALALAMFHEKQPAEKAARGNRLNGKPRLTQAMPTRRVKRNKGSTGAHEAAEPHLALLDGRDTPSALLWAALQARARDTHMLLPFTASAGLLTQHLLGLPAAARKDAEAALAALRYLPNLDYPPTVAYVEKLREYATLMAWVRADPADPALLNILNGLPPVPAAKPLTLAGGEDEVIDVETSPQL